MIGITLTCTDMLSKHYAALVISQQMLELLLCRPLLLKNLLRDIVMLGSRSSRTCQRYERIITIIVVVVVVILLVEDKLSVRSFREATV